MTCATGVIASVPRAVVEYVREGTPSRSYDLLPPEVQRALPSEADLRRALSGSENERS
jgi:hypothetical protein